MDYTKIQKELIYQDRKVIGDFGVRVDGSVNAKIYIILRRYIFTEMDKSSYQEVLLQIFNDAYYICTMALLDSSPADRIEDYCRLTSEHSFYYPSEKDVFSRMTLTLVDIYISYLMFGNLQLHSLRRVLRKYHWEYNTLKSEIEGCIPPSGLDFAPIEIDNKLLNGVDWDKHTNHYELKLVRFYVEALGVNDTEKASVVKSIYLSLYSNHYISNVSYDVDRFLIKKYEALGGKRATLMVETKVENGGHTKVFSFNAEEDPMTELKMYKARCSRLEQENNELRVMAAIYKQKMQDAEVNIKKIELGENSQKEMQAQIKEMNSIIKNLREKLGNKTVQLTVIVDAIKRRAKFCGISGAYTLFEQIDSMLSTVEAWKNNRSDLLAFFEAEAEKANVFIQGDYVKHKHVQNEVNRVEAGGTGIVSNKPEDIEE